MGSTRSWAHEEFGSARLGDERRTRRLVAVAAEVASRPAGTVTRACASSASREGAFRLLENGDVRADAIRQCVQDATTRRIAEHRVVVVAVDATSLRVTDQKCSKGIGPIGTLHRGARGIHVMSALAMTAEGASLGLLSQQMWVREGRSSRSTDKRPTRKSYGGECVRWLETLEDCRLALLNTAPGTTPWYQLDRGGDCWQVLAYATKTKALVTVRATHDRKVDGSFNLLWETVESTPVLAKQRIRVAAKPAHDKRRRIEGRVQSKVRIPPQPARNARVAVRAASVRIKVVTPDRTLVLELNAVLVSETTRAKHPVEWLLLTTHPIRTRADVLEVVRAYTLRWRIEDFHRVWKRGLCRVEDTQLRSREAIYKWATLLASVATRAMRLTHQARATPDAPATTEFSAYELEALIALRRPKKLPDREPTLGEAVRWLADLGGYTGPWNGPPGATVIGRGLDDVLAAARAFEFRDKKR